MVDRLPYRSLHRSNSLRHILNQRTNPRLAIPLPDRGLLDIRLGCDRTLHPAQVICHGLFLDRGREEAGILPDFHEFVCRTGCQIQLSTSHTSLRVRSTLAVLCFDRHWNRSTIVLSIELPTTNHRSLRLLNRKNESIHSSTQHRRLNLPSLRSLLLRPLRRSSIASRNLSFDNMRGLHHPRCR